MEQRKQLSAAGDSPIVSFFIGVLFNPWLALAENGLGVCTNAILITTTVYTRKFRNSVNILLAFESVCLVCGQLAFIFLFLSTIYQFSVPFGVCALFTVTSIVALQTGPILTLCLAFDRLIAVVAPIWTFNGGRKRQWTLATVQIVGSLIAGGVFTVTMMGVLALTRPKPFGASVVCSLATEVFDPAMPSHPLADTKNYLLCVGGFFAYFALWAVLRRREQLHVSPNNNSTFAAGTTNNVNNNSNPSGNNPLVMSRRVFRALCVYAVLDTASWLLGPLNEQIAAPLLQRSSMPNVVLLLSGAVFNITNVAIALKPVTLYWLSKEYRKATHNTIRIVWRWLKRLLTNQQQQQ